MDGPLSSSPRLSTSSVFWLDGLDNMEIFPAFRSTPGQNCGSFDMPWLNHKIKMIQNQIEIWIQITRDPHYPILSQSKYVNDCSL